ncbi:MAG: hypothetical protein WCH85_05420 [Methanomicrobiales archaeon]
MPDLKSIPDDIKWRLAADCAARLPALYDVAFRKVLGEKYDGIEREIWIELLKTGPDDCPGTLIAGKERTRRCGEYAHCLYNTLWPGLQERDN